MADWEIHGHMFTNCSCAYGCPCQFNALPTHGRCRAVVFVQIDKGHFGNKRLDGLNFAFAAAWPGAVHQGRGRMQPIIDERGDASQREALLSILNGTGSDPMKTIFGIYSAMCETISEPVHTKISIDVDMKTRLAKCVAKGVATGRGEPIKNPVTGAEHRASIVLPNGTEYGVAEIGRGWSESFRDVEMTLEDSHGQWCEAHMNQHGRIH